MRKRVIILVGFMCLLAGCSNKEDEAVSTPEVTQEADTSREMSNEEYMLKNKKDGADYEVFIGSDYAVYRRGDNTLSFRGDEIGWFVPNEDALEYELGDNSGCKVVVTLEDDSCSDIKEDFKYKYGEYESYIDSGYEILESDSDVKYAIKGVGDKTIKMEIYGFVDGCVERIDNLLSVN